MQPSSTQNLQETLPTPVARRGFGAWAARFVLALCLAGPAISAQAQMPGVKLIPGSHSGSARLMVNDFFGDGKDRWHTFSYSYSRFYRDSFFGQRAELRLRADIVAPWKRSAQPEDRHYAGAIGLGLFTLGQSGALNYKLGGEILLTGDQTGLRRLEREWHKLIGSPDGHTGDDSGYLRLDDRVHGLAEGEAWLSLGQPGHYELRPFLGAQAGYETSATAGADLIIGALAGTQDTTRDKVTGIPMFNMRETGLAPGGVTFVLGGDVSHVKDSIYFPSDSEVTLEKSRHRLRAGAVINAGPASVYIGQAWLSPEFREQAEGQRLGVISVSMRF